MKNEAKGLSKIISTFTFSMLGLKSCYQPEDTYRQEVWLSDPDIGSVVDRKSDEHLVLSGAVKDMRSDTVWLTLLSRG